jgi:sporulation related domain
MLINSLIRFILQENSFVSIPSIGSFLKDSTPSRIDTRLQLLTAPEERIGFTTERKFDDGSIVHYLCTHLGIPEKEAQQALRQWVNSTNQRLKSGERIGFEGIGQLYRKGDAIIFNPYAGEKLELDTFGYLRVSMPDMLTKKRRNGKGKRGVAMAITLQIAIVGVGIGIAYWAYQDKESTPIPPNTTSQHREQETMLEEDSTEVTPYSQIERNHEQKMALTPTTHADRKNVYYLVAGSFAERTNAEKLFHQLRWEGYNPELININGLYRVSLAHFYDKNQANIELAQLRKKTGKEGMWLLEQTN